MPWNQVNEHPMNYPTIFIFQIQLGKTLKFLFLECLEKMNRSTVKNPKKQLWNSIKKLFLVKKNSFREGSVTTIYRNHGAFIDGIVFLRRDELGEKFKTLKVGQKVQYKRTFNKTFWQATDPELIYPEKLISENAEEVILKGEEETSTVGEELVTIFSK